MAPDVNPGERVYVDVDGGTSETGQTQGAATAALASYMTEHDGDVVGFGDTRLGENAGIMDRLTKRAMIERREERQRQRNTSSTVVGRGQQTRTNGEADARKVEFWRETKNRSFVMSHDKIEAMIWDRF